MQAQTDQTHSLIW